MKSTRSGFTLMEIMVVIIVIAVLASVAGPMIGSITDQGRASATKSKMSALKSAMLAYQSDVGRLPFAGLPAKGKEAAAYDQNTVLGDSVGTNVLVNDSEMPANSFGIKNYARRWKGPYMDSDPSDFMYDAWGVQINYYAYKNNVNLWSAGADMAFANSYEDATNQASLDNGEVDDIVSSIARVRVAFTGNDDIPVN